jgi:hypothetical protein
MIFLTFCGRALFRTPARFGDFVNYVDMDNFVGGKAVASLFKFLSCKKGLFLDLLCSIDLHSLLNL